MKAIFSILLTLVITSCSINQSDEEYFTRVTGLKITEPIEIIDKSNSYVMGDGEYSIIFKTSEQQIMKWISNKPPWSLDDWKRGTVDHDIGFHCSFGNSDGSPSISSINDITKYSGHSEVIEILTDSNNYFSYEERCCPEQGGALRYHNGALLIIKPHSNTVYLSVWDY